MHNSLGFSLFVAARYLRARRREAVISIITLISIAGVSAGVMALVIALAINNGFRSTLQRALLNATAHVNVEKKDPADSGIVGWRELLPRLLGIPHVVGAAPVLYDTVMLSGPLQNQFAVIKGINTQYQPKVSDALAHLKAGNLQGLDLDRTGGLPGVILGSKLASDTGMLMNANVTVFSSHGALAPFGSKPSIQRFKVVGLFESGFYEIDDHWAYASLPAVQHFLGYDTDVINSIEIKLDDIFQASQVGAAVEKVAGPQYAAITWQEQNKPLLNAFKSERIVTWITIGLIEMVAGLNIFITLVMMVMEKYKDIAVLMSMGARRSQIRNVFMLQGVLIGIAGSVIGLIAGYTLCYVANRYRLIPLDETVYALSFVPFESSPFDGIWIAAAAVAVSFVATIYPARKATRITPVEVLRYE
jgi:lipoprotein-releasing system permease protein